MLMLDLDKALTFPEKKCKKGEGNFKKSFSFKCSDMRRENEQ